MFNNNFSNISAMDYINTHTPLYESHTDKERITPLSFGGKNINKDMHRLGNTPLSANVVHE